MTCPPKTGSVFGGQVTSLYLGMGGILAIVLCLTLLALLFAARISYLLGETGANVVSRLLGLLLAALAVQYILDG